MTGSVPSWQFGAAVSVHPEGRCLSVPSARMTRSLSGEGPALAGCLAGGSGNCCQLVVSWHLASALLTLPVTPLHPRRSAAAVIAPWVLSWRSHTYRARSHNFEPSARLVHDPSTSVQISFRGDGPLGSVMAIADAKGMVKGRVDNPAADPPLRSDGKLNVGEAVGLGAKKGSGRVGGLEGVKGVGAVARV